MSTDAGGFSLRRMIQIAAYDLAHGKTPAEIEARIYRYAPGADPVDVLSAIEMGGQARAAGQALTGGQLGQAQVAAQLGAPAGTGAYRILAYVQTGPEATDLSSVVATVPYGATGAQMRAAVQAEVEALRARSHDSLPGGNWGDPVVQFIGPQ